MCRWGQDGEGGTQVTELGEAGAGEGTGVAGTPALPVPSCVGFRKI